MGVTESLIVVDKGEGVKIGLNIFDIIRPNWRLQRRY